MKLINIFIVTTILVLLIGSGMAAKSGPIEMREGANITFYGGKVLGSPDGIAPTDLMTIRQGWDKLNTSGGTMSGDLSMGSNNITDLKNGSDKQDPATYSQLVSASRKLGIVVGPGSDADSEFYDYVTDGIDDYVQIQAACDEVSPETYDGAGTVTLMPGNYYLGDNAPSVNVNFRVTLQSMYPAAGGAISPHDIDNTIQGIRIFVNNTTNPAFVCWEGSVINGLRAFYPKQNYNATPVAYAPFIYIAEGCSAEIRNVDAGNAYRFVDSNQLSCIVRVVDCWGCPIYTGVTMDQQYGGTSIINTGFSVSNYPITNSTIGTACTGAGITTNVLFKWMAANAIAIYSNKTDGLSIINSGSGGYHVGCQLTQYTSDSLVEGYYSEDMHPLITYGPRTRIVGGNFCTQTYTDLASGEEDCIYIAPTAVGSVVTGTIARLAHQHCIHVQAPGSSITGNNCRTWALGLASGAAYGIVAVGDGIAISGNACDGQEMPYTRGIGVVGTGGAVTGNIVTRTSLSGFYITDGATGVSCTGNSAGSAPGVTVAANFAIDAGNNNTANNAWLVS